VVLKAIFKNLVLFLIGGMIYFAIEMAFRGRSHPMMVVVGGICFLLCGQLNEVIPWEMPLPKQMLICCIMITAVEFLSGLILNEYFGLAIWDYSHMPFNIRGQICLPFTIAWYFLSLVAIVLDDYLRYWFFGEDKPHYKL